MRTTVNAIDARLQFNRPTFELSGSKRSPEEAERIPEEAERIPG